MVSYLLKNMSRKMREEEIQSSRGYICADCNHSAYYFKTKNSPLFSDKPCLLCSESKSSGILVEDFLFTLRGHLRDHYEPAHGCLENTVSLKEVLKRFTYDNEHFLELLALLLCGPDDAFFQYEGRYKNSVDEAFIAKCREGAIHRWKKLAYELKHDRRFTHNAAARFYEILIESCSHLVEEKEETFNSVLTTLPPGKVLYRGRIAKDEGQKKAILADPKKELSAPPEHLATNSRMSPPGISFLYTAGDCETAIAELHPFVNDTVTIGEFITTRALNFFDFTRLDNFAHADANILDNPKEHITFQNRYLLDSLHHLISRPYRANDTSYIETQVFSEVIRSFRNKMYDGIIFGSSQRDGGFNYVIFGEVTDNESQTGKRKEYHVEFNREKNVTLYRITAIRAQAEEVPHSAPMVS